MCKSIIFRIGGDSDISDRGEQYAMALSYFFNHQVGCVFGRPHQRCLRLILLKKLSSDNPWLESVDVLAEKNHPDFGSYQRPTGGISSRQSQFFQILISQYFQERWRALNEIDAGCMENLTYEEISEK